MPFAPRPPRGSAFMAAAWGIPQAPLGDIDMEEYRANSLNQPPRFREVLQTGAVLLGTAIAIASVQAARITATLGFDWLFIDAEHTPMGPDLLCELIKTVNYYSEGRTAAVVRLPTHGHEWIAWALDAGAAGIVLPHTETADQARAVVNAARFAPLGDRSFPPFAQTPGFTDGTPDGKTILDVWTHNAAIIIQVESALGVKNAEEIAAVPGVDAIMIGSGDLRLSMRLPFQFAGTEPEYLGAIAAIETAAKRNNLPLMAFALGPMLPEKLAAGYKMLMVTADVFAMVSSQASSLAAGRATVQEEKDKAAAGTGEKKGALTNGN